MQGVPVCCDANIICQIAASSLTAASTDLTVNGPGAMPLKGT